MKIYMKINAGRTFVADSFTSRGYLFVGYYICVCRCFVIRTRTVLYITIFILMFELLVLKWTPFDQGYMYSHSDASALQLTRAIAPSSHTPNCCI